MLHEQLAAWYRHVQEEMSITLATAAKAADAAKARAAAELAAHKSLASQLRADIEELKATIAARDESLIAAHNTAAQLRSDIRQQAVLAEQRLQQLKAGAAAEVKALRRELEALREREDRMVGEANLELARRTREVWVARSNALAGWQQLMPAATLSDDCH